MNAAAEPINDLAHLGGFELLTPKPEASLKYFRDILGCEVVTTAGSSVYLRAYGDYARSTLKLTEAREPGPGCIWWRTRSPAALERRVAAIEAAGLGVGWTNGDVGRGRSYRFHDPEGHVMEIYYEEERFVAEGDQKSALKNLPQKFPGRGVGVRRVDHLALLARDVGKNRAFALDVLGFKLREEVIFENGTKLIGSWMGNNAIHHEMAYVVDIKGGHARAHHFSFWVDNREDVLRAAEILSDSGVFIEAGPSKHNNSQAFYLYSYEPGGNRIEIYSGGYLVNAPDFEPVTWNEAERGTGVYWGGALPSSFIEYATPNIAAEAKETVGAFDPQ